MKDRLQDLAQSPYACGGFLQQYKDLLVWLIVYSELPVAVCVCFSVRTDECSSILVGKVTYSSRLTCSDLPFCTSFFFFLRESDFLPKLKDMHVRFRILINGSKQYPYVCITVHFK